MTIELLLIIAATASATIIFRTLKGDYPSFGQFVRGLPVIGNALACGVCISYWFSLVALVVTNPLQGSVLPILPALGALAPVARFIIEWFAVGGAVLLLRTAIIVLLEAGAILKHRHVTQHAA